MALNNVKEILIPECVSPYRELEYIHFNGAESVHIAYNPYNQMRWELTFKMDSVTEGYSGATGSSAAYHCTIGSSSNGYVGGWFLGAFREYSSYPSTNKNTVVLDRYQGKVWINNNLVFTGTAQYGSASSIGMDFGARIDGSGNLGFYMHGNIYDSKISNAGTLVAEFFPCQRKSDGVCGLYRTSNSTFYPMTGTTITNEAAGPTVNENPDWEKPTVRKIEDANGNIIWGSQSAFPYRLLEYVHLNGTDNYINTQLKPNYPKNRAIWIKTDSDITATSARVIGSYASSSADNARRCYFLVNRDGGFGFSLGNQWVGGKATSYKNDKVLMYGTINSTGKTTTWGIRSFDDQTSYDSGSITTGGAVGQTANIYIGTNSNDSGGYDANVLFKGNIYLYRIKNTNGSGPIETDMYPVQRKSDGSYGLYDIYTNIFHLIEGTQSSSSGGPIINEYWDLTAPSVWPIQ